MKRFYKFILFVNIIIIAVFCVLFFREEISAMVYSQTGIDMNIPKPDLSWIAFWKDDETVSNPVWQETEQSSEDEAESMEQQGENVFDSRLAQLEGNTVIGINYSGIGDDPGSLALHADRIVRVKVKSVMVTAYENVVHSEITAKVKKTYKGIETDEIQIYAYGGLLNSGDIKDGQIKSAASKSDETGDRVNVLMDFCEPIEEGEDYIVFATNNNGILSPVSGNMSFFKIDGRKVTRLSSEDAEFSMSIGDFEKEYLE